MVEWAVKRLQSGRETPTTLRVRIHQRLARSGEAGLRDGVVLRTELERYGIANGCRDVRGTVCQLAVVTNNDLVVNR